MINGLQNTTKRDFTANCWKGMANKAGLENGKIPFLFFQTLVLGAKEC